MHPSSNGPVAAVLLSGQQPNLDCRQAAGFFGLGLHFFLVVIISSNEYGVEVSSSSVSVVQISTSVDDSSALLTVVSSSDVASLAAVVDSPSSGETVVSPVEI